MSHRIDIVPATRSFGQEVIRLIDLLEISYKELGFLASVGSAGKIVETLPFAETTANSFNNLDFVIFCTGFEVSRIYIPYALRAGCI